ncbi:MAG: hypothetical protein KF785_14905 [Gemmatimonadales bacterium]|nr:hypothetical protein [Gemmatimonadales bacterium]
MARLWPGAPELRRRVALTCRVAALAATLLWLAGCGARTSGRPAPLGDPCVFEADAGRTWLDTVRVVLAEPPLADGDSSAGDRFVARLLADGVEDADCRGRYRPEARQALYRMATEGGAAVARLVRNSGGAGPSVIVVQRAVPDQDLRDLLDRGADLMFALDARAAGYADAHPEWALLPTGPRRQYYLVTIDGDRVDEPSAADRTDLAVRAVRGRATPLAAEPSDSVCNRVRAEGGRRRPVVAYLAQDEVARQLAERVASLAVGESRPPWVAELGQGARAEPVASIAELRRIMARGEAAAVVAAGQSAARVGCVTPLDARVAALVTASGAVIVRRGVPPLRWAPGRVVGFASTSVP